MKKLLFLSYVLSVALLGTAQQTSYKYSPVEEYQSSTHLVNEILSFDNNGFIVKETQGPLTNQKHFVKKYDASMKLVYSTEMELNKKTPRDYRGFRNAKVCNGAPFGLFYHWIDASSTYNLVIRKLDEKGNLGEEVVIGKDKPEKFGKAPYYKLIASDNGEYLCAVGVLPFVKGTQEKWHVITLKSSDMSVVLDKTINTNVLRERYEKNDFVLSNLGAVLSYKKWKIKKQGHFSAVVAVETSGKIVKTEIPLDGKAISNHKFIHLKEGNIGLLGFYEPDQKYYKRISGHFYYTFNNSGSKVSGTNEDLGSMVLDKVFVGLEKGKASKPNQPIKEFRLVDVLETQNGELSILLEKFSENSVSAPGAPPESFLKLYTRKHKNLLEIRLDESGKKKRATIFKKEQEYKTTAPYKEWGGVIPFTKDNGIYFVWNHIDFPTISVTGTGNSKAVKVMPRPGWVDASGKKHFTHVEYGDRMRYPTCISGINADGSFMYLDQPVPNTMPLIGMYKEAIFKYVFGSQLYARNGNKLLLLMEMERGFDKGEKKYQFCRVSI